MYQSFATSGAPQAPHLIDPFQGRAPKLLDHSWATCGRTVFSVRPAVILDSNVASALEVYVNTGPAATKTNEGPIRTLLRSVTQAGCDIGCFYYAIEATDKDATGSSSAEFVERTARAILAVRLMDRERFLEHNQIVLNPEALYDLLGRYRVPTFDAAVDHEVGLMLSGERFGLPMLARMTYAALLKASLLQYVQPGDILMNLRALRRFQREELGLDTARDRVFALLLFSGHAMKDFKSPVPGLAQVEWLERLSRMKSTAWDISLLRMPDQVLGLSPLPDVTLAVIATFDRRLASYAQALAVRMIISAGSPPSQTASWVEWDPARLPMRVPARVLAEIGLDETQAQAERGATGVPSRPFKEGPALDRLITELEGEYISACR